MQSLANRFAAAACRVFSPSNDSVVSLFFTWCAGMELSAWTLPYVEHHWAYRVLRGCLASGAAFLVLQTGASPKRFGVFFLAFIATSVFFVEAHRRIDIRDAQE